MIDQIIYKNSLIKKCEKAVVSYIVKSCDHFLLSVSLTELMHLSQICSCFPRISQENFKNNKNMTDKFSF